MGLRHWFKQHLAGENTGDVPPGSSLLGSLLGREEERIHSLGEYTAESYPQELAALLHRRQEVADSLLQLDITDPAARAAAIPRLKELLRVYPHPLVYETLIHAHLDAGRWDEAKGVAFAARERRLECARSPYPEIRAEVANLTEWTPEEIDEMRSERGARGG